MQLTEDTTSDLVKSQAERAARTRLARAGHQPLKAITCNYRDGTLILEGEVPSYFHKQVAQEAIRKVNNVETIVNQIKVWT